ncbi:glycosyltransferase [Bacillus sp. FJAT-29790]|uniref:glycosyltransferase n=1 Tax=Bacillus sp. FJAT-29790 TaxID=1895002 RepID=UPI001C22DB48|nr:glycosyltransferase [Bacillus sp. FJAT-29790]MBU8880789.1 glycosyltransferase [Bacillus sp. FJAT-29790]
MNKDADTLVLLTHHFPYPPGEEFLETEIKYLAEHFYEIVIIPIGCFGKVKTEPRKLPANAKLHTIPNFTHKLWKLKRFLGLLRICFDPQSIKWIFSDIKAAILADGKGFRVLLSWVLSAFEIRNYLLKHVMDKEKSILLYSYWFNPSAISLAMLKEKVPSLVAVARAHGGDLYSCRKVPPYIPLQLKAIKRLDRLYLVSSDGYRYLKDKDAQLNNLAISRLGVLGSKKKAGQSNDGVLRIITCSDIGRIKRLELLIAALSYCKINIEWTHIGDGVLRNELLESAKGLPGNISYRFLGRMPNIQVIQYYHENPIDLFMNVSVSEGVPVSIMEAFSFGVPVIGTDVGGTGELVNGSNGLLVKKDITAIELAGYIENFYRLEASFKNNLRENAYKTWYELSNANRNYKRFSRQLGNELKNGVNCH